VTAMIQPGNDCMAPHSDGVGPMADNEFGPHDGQAGDEEAQDHALNLRVAVTYVRAGGQHGCKLVKALSPVNISGAIQRRMTCDTTDGRAERCGEAELRCY
jgi:hypothetical protein